MEASTFKSYSRQQRNMVVEEQYNLGMYYTNNTLTEGQTRVLTNFNFKDDATSLTPRGGLRSQGNLVLANPIPHNPMLALSAISIELLNDAYIKDFRTTMYMTGPTPVPITLGEFGKDKKTVVYKASELHLAIKDPADNTFKTSTIGADQDDLYLLGFNHTAGADTHGLPADDSKDYTPTHVVISNVAYFTVRRAAETPELFLAALKITQDGDTITHKFEAIEPLKLTPKEVVNSGYNMLLADPYLFENNVSTAYDILGIIPYDPDNGELLLSARTGQKIRFKVYYDYKEETNVTLMALWEWIDPNSAAIEWTRLQGVKTDSAYPGLPISPTYNLGDEIYFDFEPTVSQFQLRVSLYRKVGSTIDGNATKVMVMPLYKLTSDTSTTNKNLEPANYNLETAIGMTSWKQRVVLWGVTGAENILFTSDVNNPRYFPYPNNIDIFDENIINVVEYQTGLLVFTATKVYLATLLDDGIGFSTTLVQNRLPLTYNDIKTVKVVKTLVYFKSENYYYMIVPKVTSLTGELTLAPVSKNITNFLDNFEESIKEILEEMYHMYYNKIDSYSISLHNYYNYVDGSAIRNVYTLNTVDSEGVERRFAFYLNYDSLLRVWTSYITQVNGVMIPLEESVTENTILLDVCHNAGENTVQYLKYDIHNAADDFLLNGLTNRELVNAQYIDTGYRNHGDQHKKRFREIQLKFNNVSDKPLEFYSEFIIDDQRRQTFYDYEARHITDPAAPNYGLIYMERVDTPTFDLPGQSELGIWVLDSSKFPPASVIKVRFPVSGKGYAPRLKVLSYKQELYELLNINWVSRALYAR